MKEAKAEMKVFKIDIGEGGRIGTFDRNYATNGWQKFVEVTKDGKTYIFDNLNPQGVLKEDYIKKIGGVTKDFTKNIDGEELFKTYTKEIEEVKDVKKVNKN